MKIEESGSCEGSVTSVRGRKTKRLNMINTSQNKLHQRVACELKSCKI
jgi:hypothetical protein